MLSENFSRVSLPSPGPAEELLVTKPAANLLATASLSVSLAPVPLFTPLTPGGAPVRAATIFVRRCCAARRPPACRPPGLPLRPLPGRFAAPPAPPGRLRPREPRTGPGPCPGRGPAALGPRRGRLRPRHKMAAGARRREASEEPPPNRKAPSRVARQNGRPSVFP